MKKNSQIEHNLTFSQRNHLEPLPTQLKLGQLSDYHRNLIDLYVTQEISENTGPYSLFELSWKPVAIEIHIKFFKLRIEDFPADTSFFLRTIRRFLFNQRFNKLFDFIEFLCLQENCSNKLKANLTNSF